MNPYLVLGLNALAVLLTGTSAALGAYQLGHDWTSALVLGGGVASANGLLQLGKYGIVLGGTVAAAQKAAKGQ